jgi:5-methylcytosine-specific restriction protein B
MPPRYDLDGLKYEYAGTTGWKILRLINKRIERLLDRDHLIGHSYLLKKDDASIEQQLLDAFYRNIIPLLQEYFYGDYAKIGAVLGKGFVYEEEGTDEEDFAAEINIEYPEKDIYQIIDYRQGHPGRQYIQEGMTIKSAIQLLVK